VDTAILDQIKALPVGDRIRLVQAIWDSIEEDAAPSDLSDAQKADLERRLAGLRANPDHVFTWDEVKSYVQRNRP
jgi:putative addiction module component (TIGR02574 family)